MSINVSNDDYTNVRVLVLEDEIHIRKIICRLLRQIGIHYIAEAGDGSEGFKQLLTSDPNLILCDIHMEPVDGMTFLKKIRALNHEKYSKLPIIFLTADSETTTVMSAKEYHVDGYITKPVSAAALKSHIDHVLKR